MTSRGRQYVSQIAGSNDSCGRVVEPLVLRQEFCPHLLYRLIEDAWSHGARHSEDPYIRKHTAICFSYFPLIVKLTSQGFEVAVLCPKTCTIRSA